MLLERKFRNLVRKIADGEEVTKNDFAICNKANWESPKELLKWAESSTLQEVPSTELENLQNTLRVLAEKLE